MVHGRSFFVIACLWAFLGASVAEVSAQKDLLEHTLEQIHSASRQREHSQAIALGLDLVTLVTRQHATSDERIPQSFIALGTAYSAAGQYAQATSWFRKALAHHQRYHEEATPELAVTYRAFASNYLASGQPDLAAPYLRQSIELLAEAGAAYALDRADALAERSALHFYRKEWDAAEDDLQAAMAIQEDQLGLQSPALARSLINMGGIYMQQGNYPKARAVYLHALNMQKSVLPADDPEIATTYVNLAVYHDQMGEFAKAERYLEQALDLREKALGYTHPLVGLVIDDLVSLHLSVGDAAKARQQLDTLRMERTLALGGDHPAVAEVLDKFASMALVQGAPASAEAYMQEALALRQNYYGSNHDRVAATLYNLGKLQNMLGKYEQARVHLTSALDVYNYQELEAEEAVSALLAELVVNDLATGQTDRVEEHLLLLVTVKEQVYGEFHPQVVPALEEYARHLEQDGQSGLARSIWERIDFIHSHQSSPDISSELRE